MDSYDNDSFLLMMDDDLFPIEEERAECGNSLTQTRLEELSEIAP